MKNLIFIPLILFGSISMGADAQMDLSWIDRLIAMIPHDATTIMLVGAALEFLLRYVPSPQPMSIVYWISEFCKHFADLLSAIGKFLDQIIGQRVNKPAGYNPPTFKK